VVPREPLLEGPAAEVELGIEAVRDERVPPHVHAAVLGPAVEAGPGALRGLEHVREPPVAAREDALQERELRVVPAELDPPPPELAAEQRLAHARLLERELARPLEGGVGLRREGGDARRHPEPPARRGGDARRQLGDADHVLLGLAREPDHEVELERPPAEVGEEPRRLEQLVLPVLLLDHVAEPLRARLGGEREAGLPHAADLLEDGGRERVDARGRQRDRDALGDEAVHQLLQHGVHAAVVAGGEREERDLLVARALHEGGGVGDHALGVPLAERAVDVARLAEAAALHAPAHHLDAGAVVDDAHVRHHRVGRRREAVEVHQHALADRAEAGLERHDLCDRAVGVMARLEEGRHVEPRDAGERAQQRAAVVPVPGEDGVADVAHRLLTVAEQHAVEEGGQRLGVEGARAPGDDDRVARAAGGGAQRDAPQLEHGEEVRVGELVLEAEAHDVEGPEREVALERHEREPARAQQGLQVRPGGVDALGGHVGPAVQDVVENLEAEVGLGDLVDLREREGEAEADGAGVLVDRPPLVAEVAARPLDERQEPLVGLLEGRQHGGRGV
jgi:hypothetical protein